MEGLAPMTTPEPRPAFALRILEARSPFDEAQGERPRVAIGKPFVLSLSKHERKA